MKKKSLFRLASLIGVGSFAAVVPASCNSLIRSVNHTETVPDDSNRSNNNQDGDQGGLSNQSETRNQLSGLLNKQANQVGMYNEYKQIQAGLKGAYEAAKAVVDNTNSTSEQLNEAKTALENAISQAERNKDSFNQNNAQLIGVYNQIKEQISGINESLDQAAYSGIRAKLRPIYQAAIIVLQNGLQTAGGSAVSLPYATKVSSDLSAALAKLPEWKQNADQFANFKKFALSPTNFVGPIANDNTQQPSDFGFSAFSVAVDASYKYAKNKIKVGDATNASKEVQALTDVGWIYNFGREANDGYEFSFDYYGPSKAWLYFPFKLSKQTNQTVSFYYSLNDRNAAIERKVIINAPTVDSIQVAKVPLDDLKFGRNKVAFSSIEGTTTPMVGNFYISSSDHNDDSVYNSIFGNTLSEDKNSVTVNFLDGYGLADNSKTLLRQISATLGDSTESNSYYVIGWWGGSAGNNTMSANAINNTSRTYTFYVNAPKSGAYNVSGYTNANEVRDLVFKTAPLPPNPQQTYTLTLSSLPTSGENKVVKFDTATMGNDKTLTLQKGLNRIVVMGGTSFEGNAPNLGNVTFTFKG